MIPIIRLTFISLIITTLSFADVFMTELTDPQNSSDAGRYVELYNNGDSDVDLSSGWKILRWTNGNADPTASSIKDLTGTIAAGGFYIICNDADKFSATYGITCDQDIGTGGAADSNGDDNMAILDASGAIADMFGVAGEDGTGTGHEFEDGRAERADSNTSASATWDEAGWNIDNDSGGGDGNQYAPEGFDPGEWIGAGPASDTCDDEAACNTGADGDCEYPDTGYDCDGNCVGEVDCAGVCGGDTAEDCFGVCGGSAVVDDCGECGGDGSSCSVSVTFSVDMSIEGVVGDVKLRTSTVNGEYNPSDWHVMTDDGNGTYSHTLSLLTGVEYGYNFNNSDGSGYESGSDLGDCAGGNYGNDRYVTPGDSDITLDAVCWESCEACPEDIPGCTDETALNYDENATSDDGSCIFDWPEAANLFFSEYAEGSSNNKYLEIYNATDGDVDLSGYSLSSCSNGCNDGVSWDYPDNVEFDAGTTVAAGDVYVVCHGSADDLIQAECDQTFTYLSNGDDVFGLTQVGSGALLDIIGTIGDDPGSGWEVAGVSNGTKDHTLVRVVSVSSGNGGNWEESAGDADGSEWVVLPQNTWDYLGTHPHTFSDFSPSVSFTLSDLSENGLSDMVFSSEQDAEETDVLNSTLTSDGGSFDIASMVIGDVVGSGVMSYGGGAVSLEFSVSVYQIDGNIVNVISTITSSNTPAHEVGDIAGGFVLSNTETGINIYSETLDDGNNTTSGNSASVTLTGIFVNPSNGELIFTSTMVSELDEVDLQTFTFDIEAPACDCAAGDLTCDGTVNVTDIVGIVNYILYPEASNWDDCQLVTADFNADGVVNVTDIIGVVNVILGGGRIDSDASYNIYDNTIQTVGAVAGIQVDAKLVSEVVGNDVVAYGNGITIIYSLNGKLETQSFTFDSNPNDALVVSSNSDELVPSSLNLLSSYPNPFNPQTSINFDIAVDGFVNLTIYDLLGHKVSELVNAELTADTGYSVVWNGQNMFGRDVPSGIYIAQLVCGNVVNSQKLTLLR